jgi:hypothetical protein
MANVGLGLTFSAQRDILRTRQCCGLEMGVDADPYV